jgi:hypothetical protein
MPERQPGADGCEGGHILLAAGGSQTAAAGPDTLRTIQKAYARRKSFSRVWAPGRPAPACHNHISGGLEIPWSDMLVEVNPGQGGLLRNRPRADDPALARSRPGDRKRLGQGRHEVPRHRERSAMWFGSDELRYPAAATRGLGHAEESVTVNRTWMGALRARNPTAGRRLGGNCRRLNQLNARRKAGSGSQSVLRQTGLKLQSGPGAPTHISPAPPPPARPSGTTRGQARQ